LPFSPSATLVTELSAAEESLLDSFFEQPAKGTIIAAASVAAATFLNAFFILVFVLSLFPPVQFRRGSAEQCDFSLFVFYLRKIHREFFFAII